MGDSSSSTKQTQTNTLNPWSQQQYQNVSGQVNNTLAGNYQGSYTPYTGQLTAMQTPLQQQANQMAQNNTNLGQGYLSQAGQGAATGASYSPSSVTPQTLASTNLSPYLNPYTQDVTNATMNALNLQNQQQINNEASQFTGAGAFGGARQGVADAQTNNLFANTAASTLAGLNQANYANAQNAAQSDISNNLQGQLANQQAGLQGANLNLNASGLLGNLGTEQQNLGLNNTNELAALGSGQQATNQSYLTNLYNNYLLGQITPSQQAQIQLGLLGETPMLTNSTGMSNTTQSPSIFSDILGAGNMMGNMARGFSGTSGG